MGRKATALKSKSSTPVLLPHDGPIHRWLTVVDEHPEEADGSASFAAVALVTTQNEIHDDNDAIRIDSASALTRTLVQQLRNASDFKTQLQALQSYRSTLLNMKQKLPQESNDDGATSVLLEKYLATGFYRLLLEWSLSAQTRVPLQRAIQSNLQTIEMEEKENISVQVLQTLWNHRSSCCWKDPLHSLDVAVNFQPLNSILRVKLFDECVSFLWEYWAKGSLEQMHRRTETSDNNNNNDSKIISDDLMSTSITVVKLLKVLLQDHDAYRVIPYGEQLEQFVVHLMTLPTMPNEAFNSLGIVYAKLHLRLCLQSDVHSSFTIAKAAVETIQGLVREHNGMILSIFARVSIVQGIAASLSASELISIVRTANETTTALEECWKYSLYTSQTATDPMVRWAALKGLATFASRWKQYQQFFTEVHPRASIFDHLIQETLEIVLQAWENPPLRKVGTAIPGIFQTLVDLLPESQVQDLCKTVVNQPLNRKGRYLALEILLPYFPSGDTTLISMDSLLDGVGDRGPNTGPIADLWIKLLGHYWNGFASDSHALIENWTKQWIPSLSHALLEGDLSRRKQVASFCVVRLLEYMKRTESLQLYQSQVIVLLLNHIGSFGPTRDVSLSPTSSERVSDRELWTQLELARLLHCYKAMTTEVKAAVALYLTPDRLRLALTHESYALRLAAFQSLEAIVGTAYERGIMAEAQMWKSSIPYSIKTTTENKDYASNIIQCLTTFLDRFAVWECTHDDLLPKFYDFVSNFVIGDLVLKKGAYPGTVADKEAFILNLLESLLAFLLQDQAFNGDNSVARNSVVFQRKRKESEELAMSRILGSMFQQEAFASLFSLLHSNWDGTRSIAFRVLSKLVLASQSKNILLPEAYTRASGIKQLLARGMFLASSPRQREADTGSRVLAFIHLSKQSEEKRHKYLSFLVDQLGNRLLEMKLCLQDTLREGIEEGETLDAGKHLPLAHGVIHAVCLVVDHQRLVSKIWGNEAGVVPSENRSLYERLIGLFCDAVQLSLTIVADVQDGGSIDGIESDGIEEPAEVNDRSSSTPLNVNTGAIGANGTFSKLSSSGQVVQERRFAVQRVVIGTWLLIKETCAAVSAVIAAHGFDPSLPMVEQIGQLLISTLVSLKHAGAAFSARDSLQEIASACLQSNCGGLRKLPQAWAERLLDEICSSEKVRDSTLRRSTGYALGFVALMRSDLEAQLGKEGLCVEIVRNLVAYALPPENEFSRRMALMGLSQNGYNELHSILNSCATSGGHFLVSDSSYEIRCRVHALNILRMVVLDAPLATAVRPFVGDAIIAALLGYNDEAWAVRNSSTMVFSAAMLRAIDADKNASNKDRTSSQAITVTELFRRYPSLSTFLPAVMEYSLKEHHEALDSQLFPILQIFARTQPILISGDSSAVQTLSSIIFRALGNRNRAIREVAARSLANICPDDKENPSSSFEILKRCETVLQMAQGSGRKNWNEVDGALLTVESMISSSVSAKRAIHESAIPSLLQGVVRLRRQALFHPPSCVATAINILSSIDESTLKSIAPNLDAITARSAYLEKSAGGSLVYVSAANSTISLLENGLWEASDEHGFKENLSRLEGVLCSSQYDVRMTAVKSFKKTIYRNIDNIVSDKHQPVSADRMLAGIAKVLLKCTATELRGSTASQRNVHPHVPTVRRLSQCIMECFDGYRCLQATVKEGTTANEIELELDELWSVAIAMTEHEKILEEPAIEANGERFLTGNAAELMSIKISADIFKNNVEDSRIGLFVKAVCRLNDEKASWRSRYSAAKAIEISCALTLPNDSRWYGMLLRETIAMLQDSDSDVRSCATRAALQVEPSDDHQKSPYGLSLPVQVLCRLYPLAYTVCSDDPAVAGRTAGILLQSILDGTGGMISALSANDEELEVTRNNMDPYTLSNSSTSRRIFEEEDPNPFSERLLSIQLAIQALLRLPPICGNGFHSLDALLTTMVSALVVLDKRSNKGGIIHDLSRANGVFSSLFGLLGVTASCVYHGLGDEKVLQKIHDLASNCVLSDTLHPEIHRLMRCVIYAQKEDEATKRAVEECLFLLTEP